MFFVLLAKPVCLFFGRLHIYKNVSKFLLFFLEMWAQERQLCDTFYRDYNPKKIFDEIISTS